MNPLVKTRLQLSQPTTGSLVVLTILWSQIMKMLNSLWKDEAGFVVSSELVLISTIVVLGLVVGLAEVANGVNEELEDVGSAVGSMNQTLRYSGFSGHKGYIAGSYFNDGPDFCDSQNDINCDGHVRAEGESHNRN